VCFEPPKDGLQLGRWFFCENGPGCHFHNGHFPKKEHEVTKPTSQLVSDELEITGDGQGVNISSAAVAASFQNRTGLVTNPQKLRNHHQAQQKARRLASAASANLTEKSGLRKLRIDRNDHIGAVPNVRKLNFPSFSAVPAAQKLGFEPCALSGMPLGQQERMQGLSGVSGGLESIAVNVLHMRKLNFPSFSAVSAAQKARMWSLCPLLSVKRPC
jgi:hypothetical protein